MMLRIGLLAALVALTTDQFTKTWALASLWPPHSEAVVLAPMLNLRLGFNTGVTFGMFADSAAGAVWLLVAVSLAVVATLALWLWRTTSRAEAAALGLVIGGAVGNIADRIPLPRRSSRRSSPRPVSSQRVIDADE